MIPHKITLSDSDGAATLLALSFTTRRMVVRWGDEVTAHVTAYRRVDCTRCSGKGKLWDCRVQDEVRLTECFACESTGGQWRRETVPHGYRLEAIAGEAGDRLCRDIGGLWDTVSAQSAGVGLGALESWLRASDFPYLSRPRLRGVARWLQRQSGGALAHGRDILDDLAFEQSVPVGCGGTESDDLLGALLRVGVVRLYEYAPSMRPPVFAVSGGHQNASLRDRLKQSADASPVGAKHWYFARGSRWSELPEFSL